MRCLHARVHVIRTHEWSVSCVSDAFIVALVFLDIYLGVMVELGMMVGGGVGEADDLLQARE